MDKVTIAKSLLGVTLTGGATTAIVFAALPSSEKKPRRTREEILAERTAQRDVGFKILAGIFSKYKDNKDNIKQIAKIIQGTEEASVFFDLKEDNTFLDVGSVDTALAKWCWNKEWTIPQSPKDYEQDLSKDKDAICAFSQITADE